MSILITGSTGTIGSRIVKELSKRGVEARALSRTPKQAEFPTGIVPVQGDLTDMDSMRKAMEGISTLFLLNPVVPDELNRALLALDLAIEMGIKQVVYFSMFHSDIFLDCPHACAKYATELMIERFKIPATILRPNYFFQNDGPPILKDGIYPMPIGSLGTSMVDARDIAEVAALRLIARDSSTQLLPNETIEIHGPDVITGESAAALWSEALDKKVTYPGDDLRAADKQMNKMMSSAMAYDVVAMFRGFQRDGMVAPAGTVDHISKLLGRSLRTYRRYAEETAKNGLNM